MENIYNKKSYQIYKLWIFVHIDLLINITRNNIILNINIISKEFPCDGDLL